MPTYKVIFRKPSGEIRVAIVAAESTEKASQKAGPPQSGESVEISAAK
jgi:hypothetical protein